MHKSDNTEEQQHTGGPAPTVSSRNGIPYRTLGSTGEHVSIVGMGGFHVGQPKLPEEESIQLIRAAIDGGINFMDNSWDYNQGQSEIRMGKALKDGYRQKVFLMTKLDGRTKQEAAKQIDESLQRTHSSLHAESRWRPRLPLRYRADATQRDGRPLPQLR